MKLLEALKKAKTKPWALPAACYLLAAAAWLALGGVHAAADAVAKADGSLATRELSVGDFKLADLTAAATAEDGATVLTTTSNDPQMILEDVSGQTVRTLQMTADYEGTVREMCLYYTTAAGQAYSQDRRVFPTQQADGSYLYTLPRGRFVALRLDPCSPEENKTVTITVHRLLLNRPVGPASYFVPSWYQAFCLILYPGLAAALLSWLASFACWLRGKKKT